MKTTAASLCLLGLVIDAKAHLITSVDRLDVGQEPWLKHGAPFVQVWRDYTFVFRSLPAYLAAGDQILTSLTDARDADYRLQLSLAAPATVYLLIDDRVAPNVALAMPWVAALGFTDTGDQAEIEVNRQDPLLTTASIYAGTFPAGDVVLLQQNDTSPANSAAGMCTAVVVPKPASGLLFAFATVLCLRRRR